MLMRMWIVCSLSTTGLSAESSRTPTQGNGRARDLLIVQASQPGGSRWKELRRFRDALRGFPIAKDLLLFRPNEFDYWRDSLNHVVVRAVREGRLLYERS